MSSMGAESAVRGLLADLVRSAEYLGGEAAVHPGSKAYHEAAKTFLVKLRTAKAFLRGGPTARQLRARGIRPSNSAAPGLAVLVGLGGDSICP